MCFQHWNDKDGATLAQAIELVDSVRSRSWCIAIILMDSGNLSITSRSLDTDQKFICKSIAQYIHSGTDAHHGWTSSVESPLLVIFLDFELNRFVGQSYCRLRVPVRREHHIADSQHHFLHVLDVVFSFRDGAIVLDCYVSNLRNGTQYPCLPMPERRDWAIAGVVPNLASSNTATIATCLPLHIVWTWLVLKT